MSNGYQSLCLTITVPAFAPHWNLTIYLGLIIGGKRLRSMKVNAQWKWHMLNNSGWRWVKTTDPSQQTVGWIGKSTFNAAMGDDKGAARSIVIAPSQRNKKHQARQSVCSSVRLQRKKILQVPRQTMKQHQPLEKIHQNQPTMRERERVVLSTNCSVDHDISTFGDFWDAMTVT